MENKSEPSIYKQINSHFITTFSSIKNLSLMATVTVFIYIVSYLIRDEFSNPAWMLWWALSGGYFSSIGYVLSNQHSKNKLANLERSLTNPSGMTWTVYTQDGAEIGVIEEKNYLKAKFEADNCYKTKVFQGLNFIFVAYSTLVHSLTYIPFLLVIAAIFIIYDLPPETLNSITLGQVLSSNILKSLPAFAIILSFMSATLRGNNSLPNYKNFYEIRLRRLLSKSLPNIATANGFSIRGVNINLERNTASIVVESPIKS